MLKSGCDYSVFKSDIKPMWEDTININGVRWLIKDNGLLDQYWIDIVMFILKYIYLLKHNLLYYFVVIEYDW